MTYNQSPGYKDPKLNAGYLVPNDQKKTANQADHRGTLTIGEDVVAYIMQGGRSFYLDAWNKQGRNPKTGMTGPLLSISVKPKIPKQQGGGGYGGGQSSWAPPAAPQGQWQPHPHAVTTPAQIPQPQWAPQGPQMPHNPPAQQYHGSGHGYAATQPPVAPVPMGGQQGYPGSAGQVNPTGKTGQPGDPRQMNWQGGGDEIPF